ncbi:YoeB-YefM toxin-antitoxin system antitoxin YefM [Xenorhabdus nematophila]|uniref:YoeB-YefM toxin-antitoxin system antitoxin YefM n=1 Tax=Xenorhabdus nematophila TaxID=628 RepID=UPI0032B775E5
MKTVNYTEVRNNLTSIMNESIDDRIPILITRQQGVPCVLISYDEYQALEETAYLLRSPANARHLMNSIEALNNGNGTEREIQE